MEVIRIFTYICITKQPVKKMAHIKTENNKRKAGRPQLEKTKVVSLRIRESVYDALKEKYSKNWMSLFQDFLRVYKVFEDEQGNLKLK